MDLAVQYALGLCLALCFAKISKIFETTCAIIINRCCPVTSLTAKNDLNLVINNRIVRNLIS